MRCAGVKFEFVGIVHNLTSGKSPFFTTKAQRLTPALAGGAREDAKVYAKIVEVKKLGGLVTSWFLNGLRKKPVEKSLSYDEWFVGKKDS